MIPTASQLKLIRASDTSKPRDNSYQHGYGGTFLWAVSTLSVLSIISQPEVDTYQKPSTELSSSNPASSVTFIHGRAVSRQIQSSDKQLRLRHRGHGTRVEVRDLFGSMPVRVVQRPRGAKGQRQREKDWKRLVKALAGILLAWGKPTDFSLEGSDRSQKIRIRNAGSVTTSMTENSAPVESNSSFHLPSLRNIFVQYSFIDPLHWNSWVKSSARTKHWTVRAVMSLEPSPSKNVQFLSLGIHYVDTLDKLSWLYDEINRLFEMSSFGSIEEVSANSTDDPKQKDRQYKFTSPTKKQLKARGKGVERWPMFFVRVDRNAETMPSGGPLLIREAEQSSLMPVIRALVESFLRQNKIRVWQSRPGRPSVASEATMRRPDIGDAEVYTICGRSQHAKDAIVMRPVSANGKICPLVPAQKTTSGVRSLMKVGSKACSSLAPSEDDPSTSLPSQAGARSYEHESGSENMQMPTVNLSDDASNKVLTDKTAAWQGLQTAESRLINVQTGPQVRPSSSSGYFSAFTGTARTSRLSRTASEVAGAVDRTPWATALLENWKNPVFGLAEPAIPKITLQGHNESGQRSCGVSFAPIVGLNTDQAAVAESRVTRSDLLQASVVAQVDAKFILIKVAVPLLGPEPGEEAADPKKTLETLLILVDQHAADERNRVEALLAQLCQPVQDRLKDFRSPLGFASAINIEVLSPVVAFDLKKQECQLFKTHASHFARWGILYALRHDKDEPCREGAEHMLFVLSLPPVITERCRAEPKLLSQIMRTEIWARESDGRQFCPATTTCTNTEGASFWERLGGCPEGILDMVNSRACRSAIMFNDELSVADCADIVRKLGRCRLPFQCAHGRPSMVPVADLNRLSAFIGHSALGQKVSGERERSPIDFQSAWKAWKPSF